MKNSNELYNCITYYYKLEKHTLVNYVICDLDFYYRYTWFDTILVILRSMPPPASKATRQTSLTRMIPNSESYSIGILGSETGSFTTKWPFKYHLEMWKILSQWLNLLFFSDFFWTPPYATQRVLHPLEAPNTQPPIHPSESSNPWKPSFTWPSGTRDMGMGRINWHMYVFIQNNMYIYR